MLTQAPKGTKDMLPEDAYRWQAVEKICREVAELSGFQEIRTPIFEHTELFLRGVGDTTDIVQKEMYTFEDKGGRSITLRPEGTAGAARAFVEHGMYAGALPAKMYYLSAPIFRYEAPQSGRFRQHHQFGCEVFGAEAPSCDAEVILLLLRILRRAGLENLVVSLNSIGCPSCRKRYNEALRTFLQERVSELCATCNERIHKNPMRILDCKTEKCQQRLVDAPQTIDYLCDECAAHFEGVQSLLAAQGVAYKVDARIVRGLDYYTRTVFEVMTKTDKGVLTVCGGGRYDGLVEQLGGPSLPGFGFGLGVERLLMLLEAEGIQVTKPNVCDVYVASLGQEAKGAAFALSQRLQDVNIKTDIDHMGRSLKAQFKSAGRLHARFVAIVGGDELARGMIRLRNMQTKEEKEVNAEEAAHVVKEAVQHAE